MGFLVEVPYIHASGALWIYLYTVFRVSSEGSVGCGWQTLRDKFVSEGA